MLLNLVYNLGEEEEEEEDHEEEEDQEEEEEFCQRNQLLTRVVLVPVVAALVYWSKNVGNVVYSREIAQDAPVIMWCINIQSVYNVHAKSGVWVVTQTMSHTPI